jgi:hypothetical protein
MKNASSKPIVRIQGNDKTGSAISSLDVFKDGSTILRGSIKNREAMLNLLGIPYQSGKNNALFIRLNTAAGN